MFEILVIFCETGRFWTCFEAWNNSSKCQVLHWRLWLRKNMLFCWSVHGEGCDELEVVVGARGCETMLLMVHRLVWTCATSSRCSDVLGEWVWVSFSGRIGRFSTFSTFGIKWMMLMSWIQSQMAIVKKIWYYLANFTCCTNFRRFSSVFERCGICGECWWLSLSVNWCWRWANDVRAGLNQDGGSGQ